MLSFRTKLKLAQVIQIIAENERKLEVVRQVVAEQKAFEPYTAFKRIDRDRNGYLRIHDLDKFLNDNDVFLSNRELYSLFKTFDSDCDGRLTYNDFIREILPQEDLTLRELCTLRKSYPIGYNEFLPYEVEWALARVLTQNTDNFRLLESAKQQLASAIDFNSRDAFNSIDLIGRGFITVGQIENFLNSCDKSITNEEINAYMRIVDLDQDGRIQYSEFVESILPQEPYSRNLAPSRDKSISRLSRSQILSSDTNRLNNSTRNLGASQRQKRYRQIEDLENDQEEYYRYLVKRQSQLSLSRVESPNRNGLKRSALSKSRYESPNKNFSLSQSGLFQTQRKNQTLLRSTTNNLNKSNYLDNEYSYTRYSSPKNQRLTSPISGSEEVQLIKALKEQIQVDRDVEDLRKKLALRADFNLLDGFRIFDISGKGYMTSIELEEQLNNLGLYPSKDEIYLFFRRYDKDQDGLIRYSDFCKIITPQSNEYAIILKDRSPLYTDVNLNQDLTLETRRLLRQLLNLCITGEIQAESVRQRLARRPYFSAHDAFQALDKNDNGFITFDEFKEILQDYGFFASHSDIVNLLKRYDKNQDGRVSYGEFVNELMPKSPQKY